jgi:hypothetical protein
MAVNLGKTKVVVFNRTFHSEERGELVFPFKGAPVEVVNSYVYLGLVFEDGQHLRHALLGAVAKAKRVLHAMFGQCYKLGLHNAGIQGHLFDSLVKPVLCYGCEVWGPDWAAQLCGKGDFLTGVAEKEVQSPFMRQSLGVCKATPIGPMMEELNREPLSCHWMKMAAKLWNKAVGRGPGDFLRLAMEENVQLAGQGDLPLAARKRLWAYHFTQGMQALGVDWCEGDGTLKLLDVGTIAEAMKRRWQQHERKEVEAALREGPAWEAEEGAVRAAPTTFSAGFMKFKHEKWFGSGLERDETWVHHLQKAEHVRVVAQFRLGSHWLEVQQGKFKGVPRNERVCPHCKVVEDEMHVLECPLYTQFRARSGLFTTLGGESISDASMKEIMNGTTKQYWSKLAVFLMECRTAKLERGESVAQPVSRLY